MKQSEVDKFYKEMFTNHKLLPEQIKQLSFIFVIDCKIGKTLSICTLLMDMKEKRAR